MTTKEQWEEIAFLLASALEGTPRNPNDLTDGQYEALEAYHNLYKESLYDR